MDAVFESSAEDREFLESRGGSFSLVEPAQELAQVVAIAAHRGRREIIALQFGLGNRRASGRLNFAPARCIVRNAVPHVRPLVCCAKYRRLYYTQGLLRAMISRNKYPQNLDLAAFEQKITPIDLFQGFLE
jgi:hypothetical protein